MRKMSSLPDLDKSERLREGKKKLKSLLIIKRRKLLNREFKLFMKNAKKRTVKKKRNSCRGLSNNLRSSKIIST